MDIGVLKKLTRSGFILLHITVLLIVNGQVKSAGTRWANAELEAADEASDLQIYKSVVQSMEEWKQRKNSSKRQKRAETNACYPEVGCFDTSGPYGYIGMVPNRPDEVNTRFLLYSSRRSRRDTPLLDVAFTNMTSIWHWAGKAFNVSAPTKVIVHGFGSSCSNVWVYEMRSALMDVVDCNVICVDWEAGAIIPNYVRAAANTRLVGKQVAMLIAGLASKANLPVENVHLIGFSLGAHAAGYAGAELKNLSRITGLDPAGPLFENQDPKTRLDSTDAKFVDVIHSNGENLILGGLGAWQPMGHVDYYPNGGRMQKGCSNLFVGAVTDIIWSAPEVYGRSLCNHRRAYKFFTDSVSPSCAFPAVPCESYEKFLEGECFPCKDKSKCGNMGYHSDKSPGRGKMYLLTRDEEPFCGKYYLIILILLQHYCTEFTMSIYLYYKIFLWRDSPACRSHHRRLWGPWSSVKLAKVGALIN
uniref:Pancreatic lipase-related protein 1 n=1 Tax=Schizaphis graminum TaxID=13262 RepID=A0A2S2NSL3_SCHGA